MKKIYFIILTLSIAACISAQEKIKLTILHTNDTHSQVEPLEKNASRHPDMGGYARRMGVIEKIRHEEENVLLFDAGDFLQGTPYFNLYRGYVETDAMNKMKYDAGTIGNHEFDNGLDSLANIIKSCRFPIVNVNYDFSNTPIGDSVNPYIVLEKAGLKIGVFGLGVDPKGLVMENNYKGMTYNDPVTAANQTARYLKEEEECDLIVCLSHLGSDKNSKNINDYALASQSEFIDIIIGGHSHQHISDLHVKNAKNREIIIAQMGKSGIFLGRIDLEFEKRK
ncbi:MAG: metallophosphatase [Prevotellaceae bacterium]|jgi:5'-nucleotidase|nr:metallophosphatase [Prevotellaceae bacterium]